MLSQSKYSIRLPVISSIIMTVVVLLLLSTPLQIASPCTRWGAGVGRRVTGSRWDPLMLLSHLLLILTVQPDPAWQSCHGDGESRDSRPSAHCCSAQFLLSSFPS